MTALPDNDGFMTVQVTRTEPAADSIQLFELRAPAGAVLPPFDAGAHLSVAVPGGALRNYSLCGDPADHERYVIAVKREIEGRGGSVALIDGVRAGDSLRVSTPRNLFELVPAPAYIFIAGGIGITPIMAMIHALRAQAGTVPYALYYLTRDPAVAAFLPMLTEPHPGATVIVHHDAGDPDQAYDLWPVLETPGKAHIYCCGPRALMDAVRDMTGHWPTSALHFEDFGSDLVRPRADDTPFTVQLARSRATLAVPVGATILEVVRAHGLHLASSCESGTCGTCKTRLLAGDPDHRDLVLSDGERADHIMICVSRARSGTLTLDL